MRDVWILLVMSLITSVMTMVQSINVFAKTDDNVASIIVVCAASLTFIFLVTMAFIFPR